MKSTDLSIERTLINRCKRNDEQAQFELYNRHVRPLFNTCLRMMGDRAEAQDVLQEAFIDAFRKINQFEGRSEFGGWLRRIAINKCINALNRKKRLNWDRLADYEELPEEEPDARLQIDADQLNLAIRELPEGCRAVFTLKAMEDYDHKSIARMLGISVSTSKTQYMRARQLLRQALAEILAL